VHFVVEDIGVGVQTLRIAFQPPTRLGFSTDALDDPRVGTIVGAFGGDPERHMQFAEVVHVFLNSEDGLMLRSRLMARCRPAAGRAGTARRDRGPAVEPGSGPAARHPRAAAVHARAALRERVRKPCPAST
jgi:DAPG hydrolase PhiG domain